MAIGKGKQIIVMGRRPQPDREQVKGLTYPCGRESSSKMGGKEEGLGDDPKKT